MLTDLEIRRKKVIRDIVDLPEFEDIFKSIKTDIANELFNTFDRDRREALYHEANVVEAVRGRFVKIANDVRMMKNAAGN